MAGNAKSKRSNRQPQIQPSTPARQIKLNHIKSPAFNSCFASNFGVTGPLTNGLYQVDCMTDVVEYFSETGTYSSSESNIVSYTLSYEPDDTENMREHVARIFMTKEALQQLVTIISIRLGGEMPKADSDER